MQIRKKSTIAGLTGLTLTAALVLAACSDDPGTPEPTDNGGETSADGGDAPADFPGEDPDAFIVLTPNENVALREQLTALSENQCAAEHAALPMEHQTVAQADVVQRITLIASQDALPTHFVAGTAQVRPDGDLGTADLILDYEEALTASGAWDQILPGAASTVTNVYGQMVSLPYQYNVEGMWYNKEIFAEHNLSEPTTWDELLEISDTLLAAGVTPMVQSGDAGWPLTRIMGMYIVRNVGPKALVDIAEGNAKLTDPEYVAGAQALQDYALDGYFGEGFISLDPDAASAQFLSGNAAMRYDGSWFLGSVNNPERNQIGAENVGFFPFPEVEGGAGNINQWAANAGTAQATAKAQYGPLVADWLSCIASNYGQQALQDAGILSGFQVNGEVTDIPESTTQIQEILAGIDDETVLWFEALMDQQSNSLASTNVTLLVTDQMSAEDYMAELQASLDANR